MIVVVELHVVVHGIVVVHKEHVLLQFCLLLIGVQVLGVNQTAGLDDVLVGRTAVLIELGIIGAVILSSVGQVVIDTLGSGDDGAVEDVGGTVVHHVFIRDVVALDTLDVSIDILVVGRNLTHDTGILVLELESTLYLYHLTIFARNFNR